LFLSLLAIGAFLAKGQHQSRAVPSRNLEVIRWLPELINLDCCAIVATIQIKQVRQPSYFQNAGWDSPASKCVFGHKNWVCFFVKLIKKITLFKKLYHNILVNY